MTSGTLEDLKQLAERLSFEEQLSLMEHLVQQLRARQGANGTPTPEPKPRSLRGIWRDHFPTDIPIDAALHDIRHEWEGELPEANEG